MKEDKVFKTQFPDINSYWLLRLYRVNGNWPSCWISPQFWSRRLIYPIILGEVFQGRSFNLRLHRFPCFFPKMFWGDYVVGNTFASTTSAFSMDPQHSSRLLNSIKSFPPSCWCIYITAGTYSWQSKHSRTALFLMVTHPLRTDIPASCTGRNAMNRDTPTQFPSRSSELSEWFVAHG